MMGALEQNIEILSSFLSDSRRPFVVVSTLPVNDREAVVRFLEKLKAPVYLEGISGIREDARLQAFRIAYIPKLWELSAKAGYAIDAVLRIGGVPTFRPWRDLEDKSPDIPVLSVSHLPFTGLSSGSVVHVNLTQCFNLARGMSPFAFESGQEWLEQDRAIGEKLCCLFEEEPEAEPSLIRHLAEQIPEKSLVYLGNSLPIREWDLAAPYYDRGLDVYASRGQNGIDGQVSTFYGMALPDRENWGIFGDLTMLYDFPASWVLPQMPKTSVNLVVINNGGGKIFKGMFPYLEIQNCHHYTFENFAKHWGLDYYAGTRLPSERPSRGRAFFELSPSEEATARFSKRYQTLHQEIFAKQAS